MLTRYISDSVLCMAATAIGAAAVPAATNSPDQIKWGNCSLNVPGLECGNMSVPLDWAQPNGAHIQLGMSRLPAKNQAEKIGTLFFNPGGPGDTASLVCLSTAAGMEPRIDGVLAEYFDLFCPDPRGVGTSQAVQVNETLYAEQPSLWPQNETQFEALVAWNQAVAASALNMSGPILQHIDTVSVARDMEALRIALGGEPMNYLGLSYGTMLGAQYAELFPHNIRTMVLDGLWDHSLSPVEAVYIESTTYQLTLESFFSWCAANSSACGFQSEDLSKTFNDFISRANESPIPAPGCASTAKTASAGTCVERVTGQDMVSNIQGMLTFLNGFSSGQTASWAGVGQALNQTIASNNATMLSNSLVGSSAVSLAEQAITCLDWIASVTPVNETSKAFNELYTKQQLGNIFNANIGSASQSYELQAACLGWPVPVVNVQNVLNASAMARLPPVLMMQSTHDPYCNYGSVLNMKEQIPSAVLLTRDGVGHTSYFLGGEATAAIDAYFVNKTMPAIGTVVNS